LQEALNGPLVVLCCLRSWSSTHSRWLLWKLVVVIMAQVPSRWSLLFLGWSI